MTRKTVIIAALLVTGAAIPAQAQNGPLVARAPQDQTQRRICRSMNRVGSRLTRTVTCKTQAEWDEAAAESRRTTDRIQRVTSACLMGPGGTVVCSNSGN